MRFHAVHILMLNQDSNLCPDDRSLLQSVWLWTFLPLVLSLVQTIQKISLLNVHTKPTAGVIFYFVIKKSLNQQPGQNFLST